VSGTMRHSAFMGVANKFPCKSNPNTTPKYGLIGLLPHVSFFNWEPCFESFCFGGFMGFVCNQKSAEFWAGLDMGRKNVSAWLDVGYSRRCRKTY